MRARKQRTKRRERKREGEKKRIPRTHLQIDATKHPLFELEGHGGKRGAKKKEERGEKGSAKKESDVCTLQYTRELAFGAGIDTDRIDESEPANVPQSIPRINGSRSIFMKRARYATSKTEFNFAAGDIHVYIYK